MNTITVEEIIRKEVKKANLYPAFEDKCVNEICELFTVFEEELDYTKLVLTCMALKNKIEKLAV